MAPPGCPDFAFSTMAADKILMLSAARFVVLSFINLQLSVLLRAAAFFTVSGYRI